MSGEALRGTDLEDTSLGYDLGAGPQACKVVTVTK